MTKPSYKLLGKKVVPTFSLKKVVPTFSTVLLLTGCYPQVTNVTGDGINITSSPTPSASASSTVTVVTGTPRVAKIIFRTGSSGSFDAPSTSNGTPPVSGSGHPALRVFNADDTELSSRTSASATLPSSWPAWLTSFEIGLSGSSNTGSGNSDCARFADATDTTSGNCSFDGTWNGTAIVGGSTVACGAQAGTFRISEYDCAGTSAGTGADTDPVYIRATFSRTQLGSGENVMAVIEYTAASYSPAPSAPSTCIDGSGKFSPESCAENTWKVFLKESASSSVQPFFLFIPPTHSYVKTTLGTSGSTPSTKQILLPLAADSTLTVFQLSRINSNLSAGSGTEAAARCNSDGGSGNSPFCSGVIIHSITFYRM